MGEQAEIIKSSGNYHLATTSDQYRGYSGFHWVVFFWPNRLVSPQQLRGFRESEEQKAHEYLRAKAKAGTEQKRYDGSTQVMQQRMDRGWVPVAHDDLMSKLHLSQRGYTVVETTDAHVWYAPPAATATRGSQQGESQ